VPWASAHLRCEAPRHSSSRLNEGEYRCRKLLRRFLWQVVTHPGYYSTLIGTLEEPSVPLGDRWRCDSVVTSVEHDCWDVYRWLCGQLALGVLNRGITGDQPKTVPVGVNDHGNEVWVVERGCGVFIRSIFKAPTRRPQLPQELAEGVAMLCQTGPTTLTVKIVLVLQTLLVFRRCRLKGSGNVLNIVTGS
jgi:hypothetical protein